MVVADKDTQAKIRKEFVRESFRKNLKKIKPPVCMYCGSIEDIEYHHLIPVSAGGDNRLNNILPLCAECHDKVHYGQYLAKNRKINKDPGGRPRKATLTPENEQIIWEWANGKIGANACMNMLGYHKGTHLKDTRIYKEFIKKNGIQNIRNTFDVIAKNGKLTDGRQTSVIYYLDGEREFGYFRSFD